MALDLPRQDLIEILTTGQIELTGHFAWGSNHTFLAQVADGSRQLQAVYKPAAGERPLWDFPARTLAQRELAAYLTSQALDWGLVPPTVLRDDGPAGGGSLQLYLEIDPERHYFNLSPSERQLLEPASLFDVLINNADRKGGHVLLGPDRHVWLIDHGVSFHQENKLRTVIWDFAGKPVTAALLEDIEQFATALLAVEAGSADRAGPLDAGGASNADRAPVSQDASAAGVPQADSIRHEPVAQLRPLLSLVEFQALVQRARDLLDSRLHPRPGSERHYPWPLI